MAVTSFTESDAVANPRARPAPDDGPEPRALEVAGGFTFGRE